MSKRVQTKHKYKDDDSYEDEDEDTDWENTEESSEYFKEKDMESKIEKVLHKTNIQFSDIDKEPLLEDDKIRLVEMYNIYLYMEDNTLEKYNMKQDIKKWFKEAKLKYTTYNKLKKKEMKDIQELKKQNDSDNKLIQIVKLKTSIENKKKIYLNFKRFQTMSQQDDEFSKLKLWLDWSLQLPFDRVLHFSYGDKKLQMIITNIYKELNKNLFGMKHVKEKILSFVSLKIRNPNLRQCSLGLIGPPGVGKTLICRTLANVLSYPFQQISFGGVSSPEFLKGHDYTYIGSHPGEIVKSLCKMKYKNGILFFDEFDKISKNKSICDALLHITDPVQNKDFTDNFLSGLTIDLSNIWFIYSMNELPHDKALNDRIYTIEIKGYSVADKIQIVKKYILPRVLKEIKVPSSNIIMKNEVIKSIIYQIKNENIPGIRRLERTIFDMITKIDFYCRYPNVIPIQKIKFKYPFEVNKQNIEFLLNMS